MYSDKPDISAALANSSSLHKRFAAEDTVPEELRLAGADYVSRGRVKLQSVESPGTNLSQLTGSVQCGFGIVHHPTLELAHQDGQLQVRRHQCGCRDGAAGRFCGHCAALLVAHYGHADARILSAELAEDREDSTLVGARVRLGTIQKTGAPLLWTPEDPSRLATANIAVVGGEDTGNTQMAQSIALQLLRQKAQAGERIGLLLFDGLDDYSDARANYVEATGAKVLRLHKLPLNPFSLRGLKRVSQLHTSIAMAFADALVRAYGLDALEKSALVNAILAAYAARGITSDPLTWDLEAPTFDEVYEVYNARPLSQRSEALNQVMETLALLDLFDCENREYPALYDLVKGTLVVDMSGYPEALKRFALDLMLKMFHGQMCGGERTVSRELRKMILVDNADALLGGSCAALEDILSQGREYGVGMLLSAQSLNVFQNVDFDYQKWIRTWVLHNVEDLRKADLEFLLQMDLHDGSLERLYQASRRLRKLHSLIRIGTEEPVLAEDLPFYEIAGDASQRYLMEERTTPEPEPLAGMPLLDAENFDTLVALEDIPACPMGILDDL